MMHAFWFFKVILSCLFSGSLGWVFVSTLRQVSQHTNDIWKLVSFVIIVPVSVYVILHIAALFSLCDHVVADSFAFGIIIGIVLRLMSKPDGNVTIRLVAYEITGTHTDVWIDENTSTSDVLASISDTIGIDSSKKVYIESGKGKFLEDLTAPFYPLVDESLKNKDFFGFTTVCCFISVQNSCDTDDDDKTIIDYGSNNSPYNFSSLSKLYTRTETKYGEQLLLSAKIASEPSSAPMFHIDQVDKFAAAIPKQFAAPYQQSLIKFLNWDNVKDNNLPVIGGSEHTSETGDVPVSNTDKSNLYQFFSTDYLKSNAVSSVPMRHGDNVVLQCDGKYMSVTRGWWMQWSSVEPRRSGAFTIEITSRKIGVEKDTKDAILKTGDTFRLRSVKFQDFELGVTSVKLPNKISYCYLGLRKINSYQDDSWSNEVRFTVKIDTLHSEFNKLSSEINKLDPRNYVYNKKSG